MTLQELFNSVKNDAELIVALKGSKNVEVPPFDILLKEYEPKLHQVNDHALRPDKPRKGKPTEKVSRIHVALQQLVVRRMTEFMFALPVKRVYHHPENSALHETITKSIEAIYTRSHIDSNNIKRAQQLFASCEIATLWHTIDKPNTLYGFNSGKKLRCVTYSPMSGHKLYPYFDEYGDMLAMSVEYTTTDVKGNKTVHFDTYTAETHIHFENKDGKISRTEQANPLGKIPYIYANRALPIWEHTTALIEEIEMTLSRNSDVIAYNAAPILAAKGHLQGSEQRGETKRVYELDPNGDLFYVSWSQAVDSVKYHIDTLLKLFWLQLQLPDISLENLRGMNASGEAMKTMLTDAHLKVGDEKGIFIEFFDREGNIIKELLAHLNPAWATALQEIEIEHVITPFVQNDERIEVDKLIKMNGGKPLLSHLESIKQLGWAANPQQSLEAIRNDSQEEARNSVENLFNSAE